MHRTWSVLIHEVSDGARKVGGAGTVGAVANNHRTSSDAAGTESRKQVTNPTKAVSIPQVRRRQEAKWAVNIKTRYGASYKLKNTEVCFEGGGLEDV